MIDLHDLLNSARSGAIPVCCDENGCIDFAAFHKKVRQDARHLRMCRPSRYLLCTDDIYTFACGLFALLAAEKSVVIPANATAGHLAAISDAYDAVWDGTGTGTGTGALATASVPLQDDHVDIDVLVPSDDLAIDDLAIDAGAVLTLYTSGSSGAPKPVRKTLAQCNAEVRTLETTWGALLGDRVVVGGVPHHHIYGLLFRVLWPLAAGRMFGREICVEPSQLQARARRNGPLAFVSTPAQLSRWPKVWDLATAVPLQTIVFSSGGPLSEETARLYAAALGQAPLEVFGSTETGGIAWRRQSDSLRWRALPGVDVRLGEERALEIRSPHLGHEHWHRTDDAVVIDKDGRFALVGRLDRVVKIAGKRVSLLALEIQLLGHPLIAQVAMVALDSNVLAGVGKERVGAIVVLSDAGLAYLHTHGRQALTRILRSYLVTFFDMVVVPRYWRFRVALPYDDRGKLTVATLEAAFFPGSSDPSDSPGLPGGKAFAP